MEHLLVHCSRGKNISPAVAIVLNKIYDLGANDADLREQYREDANWYVYRTLIETAKKRGLI